MLSGPFILAWKNGLMTSQEAALAGVLRENVQIVVRTRWDLHGGWSDFDYRRYGMYYGKKFKTRSYTKRQKKPTCDDGEWWSCMNVTDRGTYYSSDSRGEHDRLTGLRRLNAHNWTKISEWNYRLRSTKGSVRMVYSWYRYNVRVQK